MRNSECEFRILVLWDVEGTAGAGAESRNKKMFGIKFVPTSERRVSLRTEECAKHMGT